MNRDKLSRPQRFLIIMLGVMVAFLCLSFMIVSVTSSEMTSNFQKTNMNEGESGVLKKSATSIINLYHNAGSEMLYDNYIKKEVKDKVGFDVKFPKKLSVSF